MTTLKDNIGQQNDFLAVLLRAVLGVFKVADHEYGISFDNLGENSGEQGYRFHQDVKITEETYQGRWDEYMMADY